MPSTSSRSWPGWRAVKWAQTATNRSEWSLDRYSSQAHRLSQFLSYLPGSQLIKHGSYPRLSAMPLSHVSRGPRRPRNRASPVSVWPQPPRRIRENRHLSLQHRPHQTIRRGCHIHVVSTTWLGHPRLILRPDRSGRPISPVTAVRRERSNTSSQGRTLPATATRRRHPPSSPATAT